MLGPNGTGQKNTARTKRAAPAEEQICPSNGSRFYHNARTMSNDFTMFSYRLCVREEACRAGRGKSDRPDPTQKLLPSALRAATSLKEGGKERGNSLRLAFWINNPSGLPFGSTTPPACLLDQQPLRPAFWINNPSGLPLASHLPLHRGGKEKGLPRRAREKPNGKEADEPPLSDGSDASYLVVMRMTVTLLPSAV